MNYPKRSTLGVPRSFLNSKLPLRYLYFSLHLLLKWFLILVYEGTFGGMKGPSLYLLNVHNISSTSYVRRPMLNDRKSIIPDIYIKTIFEGKPGRVRKVGQEF